MNISKEKIGPCRWKITVEIPADVVAQEYEEQVRSAMAIAAVDGFRPGRAPRTLVENRYAKVIAENVTDALVHRSYRMAVERDSLKVVRVIDLEKPTILAGQPARINVIVDVEPDVVLSEYRNIPVKGESVEVSDEEVEKVKQNLLAELHRWKPVNDRPANAGDVVVVDYEGFCDGKPLTELNIAFPLVARAQNLPVLADETFWLPGIGKALIGTKVGEKKEVFIEFPQDYQDPALAGKKCAYFVQVKEIREKYVKQPDEKFYANFGVKDEGELKQRIRKQIQKTKEEQNKSRLKAQIYQYLLKQSDMELPQSEVEEAVRQEVRAQLAMIQRQRKGADISDEMRNELIRVSSAIGTDRVKLRYILNKVAEVEGISVDPKEVQIAVAAMVRADGGKRKDYEAALRDEDLVSDVKEWLRREKAADWLVSQAKVEPAEKGSQT